MKAELNKTRQTIEHTKRNLKSIQAIRSQIKWEDVAQCNEKLEQVRFWIRSEVEQFSQMDDDLVDFLGSDFHKLLSSGGSSTDLP